ncbi:hypothetical protein Tco_0502485 [Tanacetum coccineum]
MEKSGTSINASIWPRYLGYLHDHLDQSRSTTTLPVGSPVLPPPLPVRPPILPPRGSAFCRPAFRVVILGGIVYAREDVGTVRIAKSTWVVGASIITLATVLIYASFPSCTQYLVHAAQ